MKKVLCFLILVCTIFVCSCSPQKIEITPIEDDVATMTIVSFDGKGESVYGLMNLGHTFIAIENTSSDDMMIGKYILNPGKTVTVAVWSILEHFGVWYNVESNYIEYCNKYNGRVSLSKEINEEDVKKISEFIKSNDNWDPYRNCGYFATKLWNTVAKDKEFINGGTTPSNIAKSIAMSDGYKKNLEIPVSSAMGYFDGTTFVEYKLEGEHYALV